ncbi:MAG: FkbM family methyltransferase [Archangiaceae bacterium]|nr:FkbM family methyltransferase [Archangiaceae bacterium]
MRLLHEAGLVRLRACRHGVMAYLTSDAHVGRSLDRYGEWAEAEVELLSAFVKPGDVVVDVGANIGTHAVPLAAKVGPTGMVLAFEPQRLVHALLTSNLITNGHGHARAVNAAVGASPGSLLVPPIDYGQPGNFGGVALAAAAQGEPVDVLPLDALGLDRLTLLKVDVEGMEAQVLAGAAQTLGRCQPVVYLEHNAEQPAPAALEPLLALGYSLRWHFSPFFRSANFANATENVFGPMVDANVLALPPTLRAVGAAFPEVLGATDTAATALARTAR